MSPRSGGSVSAKTALAVVTALAAAALSGALVCSAARDAWAQTEPTAAPAAEASQIEVVVVEAANGVGTSSPGLSDLPLTRAPFSAYRVFTLVSRNRHPLSATASSVPLPNGGSAAVTLTGRAPNGRYNVSVQLNVGGRTHSVQFAANRGDPFFTARATGADAALILGFIVR